MQVFTSVAKDEVASSVVNEWQKTSAAVTRKLNRLVNEPEKVTVFERLCYASIAIYIDTACHRANCVAKRLHFDSSDNLQTINVRVMPPGVCGF